MIQIRRICIVALFLAAIGIYKSDAQSLRGKIIYVHPSQVVKLKFRSAVDNYSFVNKEESKLFHIKLANNRTFLINSLARLFRSINLVITEGENTHLFILVYKESLNAETETVYDFSNRSKSFNGERSGQGNVKHILKPDQELTQAKEIKVKNKPPGETSPAQSANAAAHAAKPAGTNAALQTTPGNNATPNEQKKPISNNDSKPQLAVKTTNEETTGKGSSVIPAVYSNEKAAATGKTSTVENTAVATETVPPASDSAMYDRFIHLGDSTAWTSKDYKGAIKWYDSAMRLRPEASLPKKQLKAVRQLQMEQDQLAAAKLWKARFDSAVVYFKKADALKTERKFAEAYKEYKNFMGFIDTARLNEYTSSQLYYINEAKDYLALLQHYLPKPVVSASTTPPAEEKGRKKNKKRKKRN